MKDYSASLTTKGIATKNQIENLVKTGISLGYHYQENFKDITPQQGIDILVNSQKIEEIIAKKKDKYFSITGKNSIELYSLYSRWPWGRYFKHVFNPDNIAVFRTMLKFTDSLVVSYFYLSSYLEYFTRIEIGMEGYGSDSIREQLKEKGCIHTNFIISGGDIEKLDSDIKDFMDAAYKHNYKFIKNPKSKRELPWPDVFAQVMFGMQTDPPQDLYLKVEDSIVKIKLNEDLVSLFPIEPFKMKTAEDQTGIDLAFYLRILLNLAEPFGIDELICNI